MKVIDNKAFTLIELLVSIAIIAVLSAVAIVNFNSVRHKGDDAAIRTNIAALPSAASVYYDSNNEYIGFCNASLIDPVKSGIININNSGCQSYGPQGCFYCSDNSNSWIAMGKLHDGTWFCVDSNGAKADVPNSGISTCL